MLPQFSSMYNYQLFEPFLFSIFADANQVYNIQCSKPDTTDGMANKHQENQDFT